MLLHAGVVIDVEESRQLRRWAAHGEIQKRIPGFKVKLGFGLHFGWAVEGASNHRLARLVQEILQFILNLLPYISWQLSENR